MRDNIYCLMVSSVRITANMAEALFNTARAMFRDRVGKKRVNHAEFEGQVRTTFEECSLGSVTGFKFQADIVTELGKGKVTFLVREADIESDDKAEWVPCSSIEEMMEWVDPSPSRRNPACN